MQPRDFRPHHFAFAIAAALAVSIFATPNRTLAAETVDVAIVLAADVSRSVDDDEFNLQREGYARAFTNPQVLQAIQAGANRGIAVTFVEWSGASDQKVVADWTIVRDGESGAVFSSMILAPPRSFAGLTSISAAVDFSMKLFADGRFQTARRVIDISGDGTSNSGRPILQARDEAIAQGVTINGLTILNLHPNPGFLAHTQPPGGLPNYYRENVIGGPMSFLVEIEDFKSFGEAIVSKLVGEIAGTGAAKGIAAR
ncbi:MAG TPA: DUF1194 domain-containing protein [Alphaproteobacteria bacterium]|nr:DUF1194 domain-containing protein [Alphaproteobacteria bacterium]